MNGPLSGVKILDLSWHISGSYCTKLLGGYGADVIKVERPVGGDPARKVGPFFNDDPHPEKGLLFLHLNSSKKSITLNLKSKTGQQIIKELVRDADVLVENFRPHVMPNLGLGYETLRQINPRLIMTSISNFGGTGPYCEFKGTNLTVAAMGGWPYMTGWPEREPLILGGYQTEYHGGLEAFSNTLWALLSRERYGTGEHIDVSIQEVEAANMENTIIMYTYMGIVRGRIRRRPCYMYPGDIYECKDGYAVVYARTNIGLIAEILMERPELAENPYFKDDREGTLLRTRNREEFDEILGPWVKTRKRDELVASLQELRLISAPVNTPEDLVESEHLKERGFWDELEHPVVGKMTTPGRPFIMHETPWRAYRAPLLGEHNEEIYCNRLGYSEENLEVMRETGII